MADEAQFSTSAQPTLQDLATFLADELYDVKRIRRYETAYKNAHAEGLTVAKAAAYAALDSLLEIVGKWLFGLEEHVEPIVGPPLARIVGHLLGQDISVSQLRESADRSDEPFIGGLVANVAIKALGGGAEGDVTPGDAGARKLLALLGQLVVNGWFEGTAFEMLTTLIPDMDSFESVAELPEQLVNALGLSRLSRVALRPFAQTLIATPLDWKLNKAHHPTLLSASSVARQWARGNWDWEDVTEELERQGYSSERIDALVNEQRKFISVDEAALLKRHVGGTPAPAPAPGDGQVSPPAFKGSSDFDAIKYLGEAGYEERDATLAILAAEARRVEAEETARAGILIDAFARRDIDQRTFASLLSSAVTPATEREIALNRGLLRRAVNIQHLSEGDVTRAVRLAIVPMAYYRDWMTREGVPDDEQVIKELLLRSEMVKEFKADEARKAVEAERAAAAAKRQADADARKQQVEQERALARRGPVSELSRAAVRGLIPISRVEEVLSAQYDADTVRVFVADIEQQHADYLAQQQAAEDARKRAAVRHVDVGQLEQAVLADVLTLDQFRQALVGQRFAPEDIAVLAATLASKKQDMDRAKAQRAAAAAAAKTKHIDLAKFETLVRRGHHTIADYQALLRSLDFDDAAIADMGQLLQLEMRDDAAAAKKRADESAKRVPKGLSLDQMRRAVLIGVHTVDAADRYLADNGYTVDARSTLVAELQHDLDEAEAARRRRAEADVSVDPRTLPIATIARAARLGIIPLDVYQRRLVAAGYSADDVAIEMDLLVQEIADVRAAAQLQAAADRTTAPSGLTLAQLAVAVKAGVRSLEDYRAAAITKGLSPDDVTTLVRVLGDELANTDAAKARRQAIGSTAKAGDVSVSVLADQVRAGALTIGDYGAALLTAGLDPVDVDLLVALLGDELAGGASG